MKFDEWTTEAHRSLQEWNPDPAAPPTAPTVRHTPADPITTAVPLDSVPGRGRQSASTPRRLLSAAAAVIVVAAAAAVLVATITPVGTDVASGPPTEPTPTAGEPSKATPPADPGPSDAPRFSCAAADPEKGAPTQPFIDSTDVAEWQALDADDDLRPATEWPPPPDARYVSGTLTEPNGEGVTATVARATTFVAALDPGWSCTVESPAVDVADPSRPGSIVDENNTVTNRLGGRCLVPDASAGPGSVWGVDPALAAGLDDVDGLTSWSVVLADGGGNGQGPGRLWMEFTFESDPNPTGLGISTRVLADVGAAVDAAGAAADVSTECSLH